MALSAIIAGKLAAVVTVVGIAGAGYAATRPPSTDPVQRTQQLQQQYRKNKETRLKMRRQRGDLSYSIDLERVNRGVPSEHRVRRIPRILRLLRR